MIGEEESVAMVGMERGNVSVKHKGRGPVRGMTKTLVGLARTVASIVLTDSRERPAWRMRGLGAVCCSFPMSGD